MVRRKLLVAGVMGMLMLGLSLPGWSKEMDISPGKDYHFKESQPKAEAAEQDDLFRSVKPNETEPFLLLDPSGSPAGYQRFLEAPEAPQEKPKP